MNSTAEPLVEDVLQSIPARKNPFAFKFFGQRYAVMLGSALIGEVKFRTNKFAHRAAANAMACDVASPVTIGTLGLFLGRDESGYLRGGDLPWQYMQGVCDGEITEREKRDMLARTLAQLPSGVSYIFKADPNLRDRDIVRGAFARAGFINEPRMTQIYTGEPGSDAVNRMKSDARTKIRKGRKELEFTEMGMDEFFAHYRKNLAGLHSHFFLNIDNALLKQAAGAAVPQVEIIAVRRKASEGSAPPPIEAAAIVSTGGDGYCKLLRLSFRRNDGTDASEPPPHQQALKVLIVEAMNRAASRGQPLDVDGFTPGGNTVYSRFGVFETVIHDRFTRTTPGAAMADVARGVRELAVRKAAPFFA